MVKIYTVKELANILGVSESHVRRLTYQGKLPGRKWGKRIVFLEDDLKEYFKALDFVNPRVGVK